MTTILCVDDVSDNLALLQLRLEQAHYTVVTAPDGMRALRRLEEGGISAVILDWMMPGLSGLDTLKRIRQRYSHAELPVIMATALNETHNVVEAFGAGANDYVVKPIEIQILLARLRTHLRVAELTATLSHAATTDALTQLPNRRHFFDLVRPLHAAFVRRKSKLAMAMLDVDLFKRINDQYGHDAGDEVLRVTARVMKTNLRTMDIVARLGGEEFAAVLANEDARAAASTLDRLRRTLEAEAIAWGGHVLHATVSIGVTTREAPSVETMLKYADEALYRAKQGGRNRVELDSGELGSAGHTPGADSHESLAAPVVEPA